MTTDNQEFCGQSAIPLLSLRTGQIYDRIDVSLSCVFLSLSLSSGIRSVPLYDRFNERLDMSALLVDILLKTVPVLM